MLTRQSVVTKHAENEAIKAKPFLKWAGGKGQLLDTFKQYFPKELASGKIKRYVEPFLGGGAVFFHIVQNYDVDEFYLIDINEELILTYKVIQNDVHELLQQLKCLENIYLSLSVEKRREFYYKIRRDFNKEKAKFNFSEYDVNWIKRAAYVIFLNRTCFNGLFRVNSKGEFNVPFGRYKNPKICDEKNLLAVNKCLQKAVVLQGDFEKCFTYVDKSTFVYLDPPYRPISQTANFTSYSKDNFDDEAQRRLARIYKEMDAKGAKLMLSNSDPKNEDPQDNFFEDLYSGFNIFKIKASRMINCDATKRGGISELIITNY
ncbi:DNA adenine methylase [Thermoanaerobacterium sp. DL9XJH110]|uniref:DNA adenine methylase n=1 Tax=Thermoanaerobacterium sp. DL9XJH110 TaxID=3386643 RepID=UPI003BB7C3E1